MRIPMKAKKCRRVRVRVVCALLWIVIASSDLHAQTQLKRMEVGDWPYLVDIADDIAKVKSGNFLGIQVEQIAEAHAVEAIPYLKIQFVRSQDQLLRGSIANALVRLGEKDDVYWDFLVSLATSAVDSDAPYFWNLDTQGKPIAGPSPAFEEWTKAHNVDPVRAAEDATFFSPGKLLLLGSTGDPRAIPVLRKALKSQNFLIAGAAAQSLAQIQDKDSISLIEDACKHAPAEPAAAIASWLVYFDDSDAQRVFDTYVPPDRAKLYRQARNAGSAPFR